MSAKITANCHAITLLQLNFAASFIKQRLLGISGYNPSYPKHNMEQTSELLFLTFPNPDCKRTAPFHEYFHSMNIQNQ